RAALEGNAHDRAVSREQFSHRVRPVHDERGIIRPSLPACCGCSAVGHPLDGRWVTRILHRYVFREIVVPFAFGLSVFTIILLIARLLKLIELVVTRGVPVENILRLLSYILPAFLEVTVPMAMLLAILVAFGRLSADSEMVELRSSGLSLYQLIAPVAMVALLATAATAALSVWAGPWGNRALKTALFDLARTRASAGIKPQIFNDDFPGLVIYAETIEATNDRLHHVLIS